MTSAPLWFFRRLNLHQRLPDDLWRDIVAHGRLERWGHRADIIRDPLEAYLVVTGGADLDDGQHKPTTLRRGDLLGGPADLRARDETTVAALEPDWLEARIRDHLGTSAAQLLSLRGPRRVSLDLHPLLYTSAEQRLGHALSVLGERHGVELPFVMGGRGLARLLKLDAERVRGHLRQLQDRGVVERTRSGLRLHRPDALFDAEITSPGD